MSVHEDRLDDGYILPEDDDPSEVDELALRQTGETPERRACALTQLTAMIQERGEIVPHRMDDAFLIRFLRAKHMNVAYSHELMVNYYNLRKNNPDLTKDVSPTDARISAVYEEDIGSVLPYRDQLRRRIVLIKMEPWNPSVVHVNDILMAAVLFLEIAIIEQRTQIYGGVCLLDMGGLSFHHVTQFTPKVASNILHIMGKGFPCKLKEIHVLNQPWIFDIMFGLFKPFINEVALSRVHVHGSNYETLHSFVEPKYLPEIYGGTRPHSDSKEWVDHLLSLPSIIKELATQGYDVATDDEAIPIQSNEEVAS